MTITRENTTKTKKALEAFRDELGYTAVKLSNGSSISLERSYKAAKEALRTIRGKSSSPIIRLIRGESELKLYLRVLLG